MAIIDYLQDWNINKKMENMAKSTFLGKDSKQLSAVNSLDY